MSFSNFPAATPTAAASTPERQYVVVMNHEDQYSIWFAERPIPNGWRKEGKHGTREECLEHIKDVWTDMRPLSVRSAAA